MFHRLSNQSTMSSEVNEVGELQSPALGVFRKFGEDFPGYVVSGRVLDLRSVFDSITSIDDIFDAWDERLDYLEKLSFSDGHWVDLDSLDILPPVSSSASLIAAGANYREHILQITVAHKIGNQSGAGTEVDVDELRRAAEIETDLRGRQGDPYVWVGLPSAISGPYDAIQLPVVGKDVDWELELGVVIRKTAYQIPIEEAMDYVAGYMIVNDLTTRSLVPRSDIPMMGTDWFRSKNHPTFFPCGPFLVPKRYAADPSQMQIRLALNGDVKQSAAASGMLFDIPKLIAYASSLAILRPGDILITGSPEGNGSHWGRFLRVNDTLESAISGLGIQRNVVVQPTHPNLGWRATSVTKSHLDGGEN